MLSSIFAATYIFAVQPFECNSRYEIIERICRRLKAPHYAAVALNIFHYVDFGP